MDDTSDKMPTADLWTVLAMAALAVTALVVVLQ